MAPDLTYDVFLSYASQDKPAVEELARSLKRRRLRPFLDKWHLVPGEPWQEGLEEALDQSRTFAIFLGPGDLGPWQNEEMRDALDTRARDKSRRVIPVLLPGASMPEKKALPRFLRRLTWVDFRGGLDDPQALHRLVCGIRGIPPEGGPPPTPLSTRPTMIGVPHRNPYFTGREELLSRLHQQLQTQGISALAQAAIHGLGGIGKTQTAIEYAHRFGEHYRVVLWVVAESKAALPTAYLSIARELGLIEAKSDFEVAVLAVKAWLSREGGWLLVFDNADDPALVRPYLPSQRTGGKVLLTSRAKTFADIGISVPFRVEPMDPKDAVAFLLKRTKRDEAGPAAELSKELGYLPLALAQAAAYIDTVGVSLSAYLASFRRRGLQLLEKGRPDADYPASVATTWDLSFSNIKSTSPASAELVTAAAFLVPDGIPIEIFTRGGSEFGIMPAQELKDADEDPLAFWELLEPLERFSLVERSPRAYFKLHRLTQEVIKASLNEESRKAWSERVVQALNVAYPSDKFDENWELCERLQPSVWLASKLARTYKLGSAEAGQLFAKAGLFALSRCSKHLNELPLEKIEVHDGKLEMTIEDDGQSVIALIHVLNDIATIKDLHEQSLDIRERALGDEHPDTLVARYYLATTLFCLGDRAGARKLHMRNLHICERLLANEHPFTTVSTWMLLKTVSEMNDPEVEAQLIDRLRWLLDRDEDSIPSADQRKVRQKLLDLLNRS